MTNETANEILWFEALLDCLEDGEIEDAIETVKAVIQMLRRKE